MELDTPTLLSALGVGLSVLFGAFRILLNYIQDLRKENANNKTTIEQIANEFLTERQAHQTTKNSLSDVTNRLRIVEDKYVATTQQKDLLQQQLDKLYLRLGDLEADFKQKFEAQAETIAQQSATIREQEMQIESLQKDVAGLKNDLVKAQERSAELQKLYELAQRRGHELERENQLKIQELKTKQARIDALTRENRELQAKIEQFMQAIANNHDMTTRQISALQETVGALTNAVARLSSRLEILENEPDIETAGGATDANSSGNLIQND